MPDPYTSEALDSWWADLNQSPLSRSNWSYLLNGDGIVDGSDEISQTINTILLTPMGTDLHRPTFASDIWTFIDWPVNRVSNYVIRESLDAVESWEPRVDLDTLNLGVDAVQASVALRVNWSLLDNPVTGESQVIYDRFT